MTFQSTKQTVNFKSTSISQALGSVTALGVVLAVGQSLCKCELLLCWLTLIIIMSSF